MAHSDKTMWSMIPCLGYLCVKMRLRPTNRTSKDGRVNIEAYFDGTSIYLRTHERGHESNMTATTLGPRAATAATSGERVDPVKATGT